LHCQVFESTGIQILTDLSFVNSCETITDAIGEPEYEEVLHSPVAFSAGAPQPILEESIAYDEAEAPVAQVQNRIATKVAETKEVQKPKVALRNYFPENWLFDLMTTRESAIKR